MQIRDVPEDVWAEIAAQLAPAADQFPTIKDQQDLLSLTACNRTLYSAASCCSHLWTNFDTKTMSATQVKLRLDRACNAPLHVRWEIYRNAPTDVPGDSREKLHAIAERAIHWHNASIHDCIGAQFFAALIAHSPNLTLLDWCGSFIRICGASLTHLWLSSEDIWPFPDIMNLLSDLQLLVDVSFFQVYPTDITLVVTWMPLVLEQLEWLKVCMGGEFKSTLLAAISTPWLAEVRMGFLRHIVGGRLESLQLDHTESGVMQVATLETVKDFWAHAPVLAHQVMTELGRGAMPRVERMTLRAADLMYDATSLDGKVNVSHRKSNLEHCNELATLTTTTTLLTSHGASPGSFAWPPLTTTTTTTKPDALSPPVVAVGGQAASPPQRACKPLRLPQGALHTFGSIARNGHTPIPVSTSSGYTPTESPHVQIQGNHPTPSQNPWCLAQAFAMRPLPKVAH
ncbi:hypothetical protein C8J57DRAFT_1496103 [Mycena rebaudengoi]|nr:hypothetical protein C8J57DRAFT_1496103 [Mycena rebaudengoi]